MTLRPPGGLRVLQGDAIIEPLSSLGHCLVCHRGVFLTRVTGRGSEPYGFCSRHDPSRGEVPSEKPSVQPHLTICEPPGRST